MGSYPFQRFGRFGTRLVLQATESKRLNAAAGEFDAMIAPQGGSGEWDPAV